MNTETPINVDKLAAALSAAQGTWQNPAKDGTNPHFQSRYATLDALQDATRKGLSENGLAVTQLPQPGADGSWVLETVLLHASGQYIISRLPLMAFGKGPQAAKSETTYMRRIGYEAILNITGGEDDDGNAAQDSHKASLSADRPHRDYKLDLGGAMAAQAAVAQGATDMARLEKSPYESHQTGRITGVNTSSDGQAWFIDISDFSSKELKNTVWTRDKSLAEGLLKDQGRVVTVHVRLKKAGSYQLLSYVPSEDQSVS